MDAINYSAIKIKSKRSKVFKTVGTFSFTVPQGIVKNSDGTCELYITACAGGGGAGWGYNNT